MLFPHYILTAFLTKYRGIRLQIKGNTATLTLVFFYFTPIVSIIWTNQKPPFYPVSIR